MDNSGCCEVVTRGQTPAPAAGSRQLSLCWKRCCRSNFRVTFQGLSRRGCPGLCAESLPQPSSSAVCPYNPANTVVHGKFISLKAAFLSPLSLLLWFWLFCKANLERALSFQTEIHTHSFSFHLCNAGSVVQRMQYYFWQQNCGRKWPCVFLSHPTQRNLVIVLEIESVFFLRLGCYWVFWKRKAPMWCLEDRTLSDTVCISVFSNSRCVFLMTSGHKFVGNPNYF